MGESAEHRASDRSYHNAMESESPVTSAQPLFHRRVVRVISGALAVLGVVGIVIAAGIFAGWFGSAEVTVDPVPTAAAALSPEEQAYYAYVAPRMHEAGAQARELARLGDARSRNIFDLQAHAGRLADLASEIDAFDAANGIPAVFTPAHEAYLEGIRLANRAIDEAERAVLSADWERLGRVVAIFVAGAEEIEIAAMRLDAAGGETGPATPTAAALPRLKAYLPKEHPIVRAV